MQQLQQHLNEVMDCSVVNYQTQIDHSNIPSNFNANGTQTSEMPMNLISNQNVCEPELQAMNTITDSLTAPSQELTSISHPVCQSPTSIEQNIQNTHAAQNVVNQTPLQNYSTAQIQDQMTTQSSGIESQQIQSTPHTDHTQLIQIGSTSAQPHTSLISQPIKNVQSAQPIQNQANIQAHHQDQDHHHQQSQQPVSVSSSAPSTNSGQSTKSDQSGGEVKQRRSNKSSERIPKLVILSVQNGTLVDCSMESKLKTIKFKFDISDVNPIDVANDLVSLSTAIISR